MKNELTFRYAERKDTGLILQFIKELADYEKLLHELCGGSNIGRMDF